MNFHTLAIWTGFVPVALAATFLAACGGDDDGGPGGTGSDEDFVADICRAGADFSKALQEVFSDPSALADEDKAIEKLSDAFEAFANDFAEARPPADLKEWHSESSKQLDDGVQQLKDGNLEGGVFAGDNPFPEPPAEAGERLSKIAETNEHCQDADFSFTG